jgi:hypothetical protein
VFGPSNVRCAGPRRGAPPAICELELDLIQTHMTQKPLLWVEVGAHAVRERSESPLSAIRCYRYAIAYVCPFALLACLIVSCIIPIPLLLYWQFSGWAINVLQQSTRNAVA